MSRENEVRGDWKSVVVGTLAGWFALSLIKTLRLTIDFQCEGPSTKGPRILALYHNRMIGAAAVSTRWMSLRPGSVLTSASKDGAVLAASMKSFMLGSVRGSSSRRGAAALVTLRKELRKGHHIGITPDGPKGPIYEIKTGVIKLASVTEVPIIPFLIKYDNYWELKSWDKFQIPKPFSKVSITFAKEIRIPAGLGAEELEMERKKMEVIMRSVLNPSDR